MKDMAPPDQCQLNKVNTALRGLGPSENLSCVPTSIDHNANGQRKKSIHALAPNCVDWHGTTGNGVGRILRKQITAEASAERVPIPFCLSRSEEAGRNARDVGPFRFEAHRFCLLTTLDLNRSFRLHVPICPQQGGVACRTIQGS
jgi:hypothetical protein